MHKVSEKENPHFNPFHFSQLVTKLCYWYFHLVFGLEQEDEDEDGEEQPKPRVQRGIHFQGGGRIMKNINDDNNDTTSTTTYTFYKIRIIIIIIK